MLWHYFRTVISGIITLSFWLVSLTVYRQVMFCTTSFDLSFEAQFSFILSQSAKSSPAGRINAQVALRQVAPHCDCRIYLQAEVLNFNDVNKEQDDQVSSTSTGAHLWHWNKCSSPITLIDKVFVMLSVTIRNQSVSWNVCPVSPADMVNLLLSFEILINGASGVRSCSLHQCSASGPREETKWVCSQSILSPQESLLVPTLYCSLFSTPLDI